MFKGWANLVNLLLLDLSLQLFDGQLRGVPLREIISKLNQVVTDLNLEHDSFTAKVIHFDLTIVFQLSSRDLRV